MKKNLSRVLALALVLASLLSLTVGASADGTKVVIPNKISRLEAQLPEREAQPTVKTKTKNGEIMVRVSGDPDTVYANWLGYGESKEEVELENGLGYVELEGHKYQLGAKWNKTQYRSYFAYDAASGEWKSVAYKGTVKVGNTTMKLIDEAVTDVADGKTTWAWIYDYVNTDEVEEGKAVKTPGTATDGASVIAAGLPKEPAEAGANSNTKGLTGATVKTVTDIDDPKAQYEVEKLVDENGLEIAYNIDGETPQGATGSSEGWTYMVPFYQFMEVVTGKDSNGTSNGAKGYKGYTYAWIVEKGPWQAMYDRAGVAQYVSKTEENTDYFKTGLAGNTGKVGWNVLKTPGKKYNWYVESVVENYAEGDIAKAEAVYNVNGELVRYFITYRTGENETYRIKYTPANKPAYGWYAGVDEFTGEAISAESNSLKTWRDDATGKLTSQVELDWGLTALKDWTNPPRLTK